MRRTALIAAALALASGCGANMSPEPSQALRIAPQPATTATPDTPSTSARGVSDPARIRIPSIGVDAPLVPLGLAKDGSMETPDFGHAGWYEKGPRPGEDGPAVIAAHVDSKTGPDVFAKLRTLKRGAKIQVTDKKGRVHEFVARRSQQTEKTELPVKAIWGATDGPTLRLITCGGAFDKGTGHYRENVVLFADAA